jgi:chromosome segregation ATPase
LIINKQVTKLKSQLQASKNESSSNDIEIIKDERDQLKKRITELLKEVQDKDNTVEEMVLKINELKETEMKYLDVLEKNTHLVRQLDDKDKDLELNKMALDNLQTALNEQQESYEWSINDVEKEKNDLEEIVKKLENNVVTIESEVKGKLVDNSKFETLEKANNQLISDNDQLIIQKESLANELETVKDNLKNQELSKGNLVSIHMFYKI